MDGVRGDVRVRDEDGKLDEEDGERGEGVLWIAEGGEVDGAAGPDAGVLVVGEAILHERDGEAAHGEADEGDDAGGPGEADLGREVEDDDGEEDAAEAAGGAGDARGEGAALVEVVADDGDGRVEEEGGGGAAEEAEAEEELVELCEGG